MANQRVKFKIGLEKLVFEYEGDRENAERVQAGISRTLESITAIQNEVGGVPPPTLTLPAAPEPAPARRARRSKTSAGADGTTSLTDEDFVDLRGLISSGFFAEERKQGDVEAKLKQLARQVPSPRSLGRRLAALTARDELSRRSVGKQWVYTSVPK